MLVLLIESQLVKEVDAAVIVVLVVAGEACVGGSGDDHGGLWQLWGKFGGCGGGDSGSESRHWLLRQ